MLHLCRTHYMPVAAFRVDREGDLLKRKSRVKKHFFFLLTALLLSALLLMFLGFFFSSSFSFILWKWH